MEAFQVLLIVIGLANVALLGVLVWKIQAFDERFGSIHRMLQKIAKQSAGIMWPSFYHLPHRRVGGGAPPEYFVYWQWMDGVWRCRPEMLPAGVEAGLPPAYPGAYHGQVIKTWQGRKE
jgi:hypothetical protein